jgi:hypothetical protein
LDVVVEECKEGLLELGAVEDVLDGVVDTVLQILQLTLALPDFRPL